MMLLQLNSIGLNFPGKSWYSHYPFFFFNMISSMLKEGEKL